MNTPAAGPLAKDDLHDAALQAVQMAWIANGADPEAAAAIVARMDPKVVSREQRWDGTCRAMPCNDLGSYRELCDRHPAPRGQSRNEKTQKIVSRASAKLTNAIRQVLFDHRVDEHTAGDNLPGLVRAGGAQDVVRLLAAEHDTWGEASVLQGLRALVRSGWLIQLTTGRAGQAPDYFLSVPLDLVPRRADGTPKQLLLSRKDWNARKFSPQRKPSHLSGVKAPDDLGVKQPTSASHPPSPFGATSSSSSPKRRPHQPGLTVAVPDLPANAEDDEELAALATPSAPAASAGLRLIVDGQPLLIPAGVTPTFDASCGIHVAGDGAVHVTTAAGVAGRPEHIPPARVSSPTKQEAVADEPFSPPGWLAEELLEALRRSAKRFGASELAVSQARRRVFTSAGVKRLADSAAEYGEGPVGRAARGIWSGMGQSTRDWAAVAPVHFDQHVDAAIDRARELAEEHVLKAVEDPAPSTPDGPVDESPDPSLAAFEALDADEQADVLARAAEMAAKSMGSTSRRSPDLLPRAMVRSFVPEVMAERGRVDHAV